MIDTNNFDTFIKQFKVTDKELELMKQAYLQGWQSGFDEGYEAWHE